jgi:hypothetical protein
MNNQKVRNTTRAIFYVNAATWVGLSVFSLRRMGGGQLVPGYAIAIIVTLMFGNAGVMALSGWGIGRGGGWFYFLALAVVMVNILLTFTDQVGVLDWITVMIDLILLVLLLVYRKVFLLKNG